MAAGLAAIRHLEQPGTYERLEAISQELKEQFRFAATRHRVSMCTPGLGSVFAVLFSEQEPRNYRDVLRADSQKRRLMDLMLLHDGVFLRPGDRFNVSVAHADSDIAETGAVFARAIARL